MLTDDERTTLIEAADTLDFEGADHLAARVRAIVAPRAETVGELLATAPLGSVVEWTSRRGTLIRARVGDAGLVSQFVRGAWGPYAFALRTSDLRTAARIVEVTP